MVAYARSEEVVGGRRYYRFLAGENQWITLPDDPLLPVHDPFVVEYKGRFIVFESPILRGGTPTELAAVYDPGTNDWEQLADSGTGGYQVWRADSLLYLNPHFGNYDRGGIYEPDTNV